MPRLDQKANAPGIMITVWNVLPNFYIIFFWSLQKFKKILKIFQHSSRIYLLFVLKTNFLKISSQFSQNFCNFRRNFFNLLPNASFRFFKKYPQIFPILSWKFPPKCTCRKSGGFQQRCGVGQSLRKSWQFLINIMVRVLRGVISEVDMFAAIITFPAAGKHGLRSMKQKKNFKNLRRNLVVNA